MAYLIDDLFDWNGLVESTQIAKNRFGTTKNRFGTGKNRFATAKNRLGTVSKWFQY